MSATWTCWTVASTTSRSSSPDSNTRQQHSGNWRNVAGAGSRKRKISEMECCPLEPNLHQVHFKLNILVERIILKLRETLDKKFEKSLKKMSILKFQNNILTLFHFIPFQNANSSTSSKNSNYRSTCWPSWKLTSTIPTLPNWSTSSSHRWLSSSTPPTTLTTAQTSPPRSSPRWWPGTRSTSSSTAWRRRRASCGTPSVSRGTSPVRSGRATFLPTVRSSWTGGVRQSCTTMAIDSAAIPHKSTKSMLPIGKCTGNKLYTFCRDGPMKSLFQIHVSEFC